MGIFDVFKNNEAKLKEIKRNGLNYFVNSSLYKIDGLYREEEFIKVCDEYIFHKRDFKELETKILEMKQFNEKRIFEYNAMLQRNIFVKKKKDEVHNYFDGYIFNDNISCFSSADVDKYFEAYIRNEIGQEELNSRVDEMLKINMQIKAISLDLDDLKKSQSDTNVINVIDKAKSSYESMEDLNFNFYKNISHLKSTIDKYNEDKQYTIMTLDRLQKFNMYNEDKSISVDEDKIVVEYMDSKNASVLKECNKINSYISTVEYIKEFFEKKGYVPFVGENAEFIEFWMGVNNSISYELFDESLYIKMNEEISIFEEQYEMSTLIEKYRDEIKEKLNDLKIKISTNKILENVFLEQISSVQEMYSNLSKEYRSRETNFYDIVNKYVNLNNKLTKLTKNYNDMLTPIRNTIAMLDIESEKEEQDILDYYVYSISKAVERRMNVYGSSKQISNVDVENFIDLVDDKLYILTNDQRKAIYDCVDLLNQENTASCLIQGDVSSGKTIVTVALMFIMALKGMKSVYIVPRRILRKQHLNTLRKYNKLFELGLKIYDSSEDFDITDADIILNGYSFSNKMFGEVDFDLGVIDEIQLFGVDQRNQIQRRYPNIDMFYTTATPHPRTKLISLIGNMDIVEIREMPPGRKSKKTEAFMEIGEKHVNRIYEEVIKGHTVLVVCPLVNKSGINDYESLHTAHLKYKEMFSMFNVEKLMANFSEDRKEKIIEDVVEGKINILVTSKVIEVGVDIPNASVIIIHYPHTNSIKWGVSQLHQLRGRVGRSNQDAYCFIETPGDFDENSALGSILRTEDVFELTKDDFNWRGFEKIIGTKQSGKSGSKKDQEKRINAYQTIAKHTPDLISKLDREFVAELERIMLRNRIENLN